MKNRLLAREFLTTRAGFLKGLAAAFGARLFAAPPGWTPPGKANLIFGVVSDTHLRTTADGKYSTKYWSDKWLVAALRCFRDNNVDAVLHLGDMAHTGQVAEMEFHAAAWRKVFPKDLAPDGHKVERLFVAGNHDLDGTTYGIGELVKKLYPDPEEFKKHVLCTDIAGNWQRIWGEPYAEAWHKVVKGYHFFGRHYAGKDFKACEAKTLALVKEVDAKCGLAKDKKPFFHFSHIRAHATFNKAMAPYRNAVGFFGHWHASAANWSVIRMFGSFPTLHCPSCAPMGSNSLSPSTCKWAKAPFAEGTQDDYGRSRQGYIVRVFDDMVVFERHEFGKGGKIGADWIMPLGKYDPHPFARTELLKVIGKPQFKPEAKLVVEPSNAQNLRLSIPPADGNPDCRAFAYAVAVSADKPSKPLKYVFASGCNVNVAHAPNGGVTTLEIPSSELPKDGGLVVSVTPTSSLGTFGKPIELKCGDFAPMSRLQPRGSDENNS